MIIIIVLCTYFENELLYVSGNVGHLEFGLASYYNSVAMRQAVKRIPYRGGGTNITGSVYIYIYIYIYIL